MQGLMGISHITQKQVVFKDSFLFSIDVYVVVSVYVCGHLRRPEEVVGSPETAVTEGCGLTNVCTGNQAYVLNRSRACSLTSEPPLQSPVASQRNSKKWFP